MKKLKKFLIDIAPPALLSFYFDKTKKYGFFEGFENWDQAMARCTGYDAEVIIDKVKEASLKVKNGQAAYERDSVLFDKIQYSWPVLASLLWIAGQNGNKLNLVDFGGALGSSYYQNRNFLAHLAELKWNIVEQKKFVDLGRQSFQDERLAFYHDLDECLRERSANAILLSGVLQYLERPYDLIEKIINKKFEYVIIDRISVIEGDDDRMLVQKVPPAIYDASYPCWALSERKLLSRFAPAYDRIADFDSEFTGQIKLKKATLKFRGYILKNDK